MIRQTFLILTVIMLALLLTIGRAIGADIRVHSPRDCLLAADMALVAASFAPLMASKQALAAGIDPIYLPTEVSPIVAQRIISRAWARKSERPAVSPRDWAAEMRDACGARAGDLNAFLAEPL